MARYIKSAHGQMSLFEAKKPVKIPEQVIDPETFRQFIAGNRHALRKLLNHVQTGRAAKTLEMREEAMKILNNMTEMSDEQLAKSILRLGITTTLLPSQAHKIVIHKLRRAAQEIGLI